MFLLWIIEENAPGGGFSFLPGGGEFAHPKNCPGVLPEGGGWSGLELTDTLRYYKNNGEILTSKKPSKLYISFEK